MRHWHAYAYTGPRPDGQEPPAPGAPPLTLAATVTTPEAALRWLEEQITQTPPALPARIEATLGYTRTHLHGHPGQVAHRYYTASGWYAARDLVLCVTSCPQRPAGSP